MLATGIDYLELAIAVDCFLLVTAIDYFVLATTADCFVLAQAVDCFALAITVDHFLLVTPPPHPPPISGLRSGSASGMFGVHLCFNKYQCAPFIGFTVSKSQK